MTIDTDKLKALALAATSGPWQAGYGNGVLGGRAAAAVAWDLTDVRSMPVIKGEEVITWLACYKPDSIELRALSADAAYIAAACPATVLELIAEVERLRADAARIDFMITDECQIERMDRIGATPLYRLRWPWLEEQQAEWSASGREAIDAAIAAKGAPCGS